MSETNLTPHETHAGFQARGNHAKSQNFSYKYNKKGGANRGDRGHRSKTFSSSSRRRDNAYSNNDQRQWYSEPSHNSQNDNRLRFTNESRENPNWVMERENRYSNTNVTSYKSDEMANQTMENSVEATKYAPLNPGATEFKPGGSASHMMGMSQEAMLQTARPDQYVGTDECTSDISYCNSEITYSTTDETSENDSPIIEADEAVVDVTDAMSQTSLSLNSVLDSVDAAAFKGLTLNTSGKIQDSARFKPSRNVSNVCRADYSHNDNFSSKPSSFDVFWKCKLKTITEYTIVSEQEADLFAMDETYALGNCVAADLNMGSGIAVGFRQRFKNVNELLQQRQKAGGLAFLRHTDGRYVYYLITKQESSKKPTYASLYSSLEKLKKHMVENNVKKLAIPRLGCGLDRLDWDKVKPMIEYIFTGTDVEMTVCNFQKNYGKTKQKHQVFKPDLKHTKHSSKGGKGKYKNRR